MSKAKNTETDFTTKKIVIMSIALLLFCTIVSILFTANADENRAAQFIRGRFEPKAKAQDGMLEIEGVEAIGEVPEGEIRYYINKEPIFPSGYERGDVLLQNPESSMYALQFRFYLADGSSSAPVYTSALLHPGQYIDGDKLDRYLPPGSYACTYTATAYDLADETVVCGSTSGLVTLTVIC